MCCDVIVTIGDPLTNKLGGTVKILFWCHVFYHCLEVWVMVDLVEDVIYSCF